MDGWGEEGREPGAERAQSRRQGHALLHSGLPDASDGEPPDTSANNLPAVGAR